MTFDLTRRTLLPARRCRAHLGFAQNKPVFAPSSSILNGALRPGCAAQHLSRSGHFDFGPGRQ